MRMSVSKLRSDEYAGKVFHLRRHEATLFYEQVQIIYKNKLKLRPQKPTLSAHLKLVLRK